MAFTIINPEWLSVNDFVLARFAVRPVREGEAGGALSDIKQAPPTRNTNRAVPGRSGRLPNVRVADELVALIPLLIQGGKDFDDVPTTDPAQGLNDNWAALKTELGVATIDAPAAPVTSVWHQYDGTELTAMVIPELIGFAQYTHEKAHTVLRLTAYDGGWA